MTQIAWGQRLADAMKAPAVICNAVYVPQQEQCDV